MGENRGSANNLAWLREAGRIRAIRISACAPAATSADQCCFYAPDFALTTSTPWLHGEKVALQLSFEPLPALIEGVQPSAEEFAGVHADILSRIRHAEFQKVVPMVAEELHFERPLSAAMFADSMQRDFAHQYNYGFTFDGEGMCGVTPEILFAVQGARLTTMALAGTGLVGGPSLLDDAKERREHQLVIDHISEELKDLGVLNVGQTSEREYGALKHLYTPLDVNLERPPQFADLVRRLHPTAALGGWPRTSAWRWLEQQKFHLARARFGAPFGWQEAGEMFCVVAIRGLQWWGQRALLSSGCGVVLASQAEREWQELNNKRQATRRLLGLAVP